MIWFCSYWKKYLKWNIFPRKIGSLLEVHISRIARFFFSWSRRKDLWKALHKKRTVLPLERKLLQRMIKVSSRHRDGRSKPQSAGPLEHRLCLFVESTAAAALNTNQAHCRWRCGFYRTHLMCIFFALLFWFECAGAHFLGTCGQCKTNQVTNYLLSMHSSGYQACFTGGEGRWNNCEIGCLKSKAMVKASFVRSCVGITKSLSTITSWK